MEELGPGEKLETVGDCSLTDELESGGGVSLGALCPRHPVHSKMKHHLQFLVTSLLHVTLLAKINLIGTHCAIETGGVQYQQQIEKNGVTPV